MEITEIRIKVVPDFPGKETASKIRGYASVVFDNVFLVRDFRIIESEQGYFVAMPSRKLKTGAFREVAHPVDRDFHRKLDEVVLKAYEDELNKPIEGESPLNDACG